MTAQQETLNPSRSPRGALVRLGYVLVGVWAATAAIATSCNAAWVQRAERQAQVGFYAVRGAVAPPDDVVILAIDQESLAQGEFYQSNPSLYAELEPIQAWAWQRTAYAIAIERLMAAGARAVALDLILTDPSPYGAADDQRLRQVLQRYGDRVVLATQYEAFDSGFGAQLQLIAPHPVFEAPPTAYGSINFSPDPDGRVYRLNTDYFETAVRPIEPLMEPVPAFAAALLRSAQPSLGGQTGDIFYYGTAGTFAQVPFWHVLNANNWQAHRRDRTFDNKLVLIGATAATLQDFLRTPVAEAMPGVEVHANAVATLLQDRAIAPAIPHPVGQGLFVLLGVGGAGVLIRVLRRPVAQLLGTLLIAAVWVGVSYGCFTQAQLTLPTVIPIGAIGLGGLSGLTTGAIGNQLEQRRLRRTLERYVGAPIVQEILTHYSDDFQALLKGRRVKAAVLFCDIRGFTSVSLQIAPEQLIEQLNVYLNAMVEAILEAGGTVDKFIGDAVMAEFGSPISQGEQRDAMNAIRAALAMRKALTELHHQWQQQGKMLFFNGIGINYGEAIAGDIGSYRRREYALIGDAVNVASRVEGLTRQLDTDILITRSLYELVKDQVEVVEMGEHPLKGRGENVVRLYGLVGLKGEDPALYQQVQAKLKARRDEGPC